MMSKNNANRTVIIAAIDRTPEPVVTPRAFRKLPGLPPAAKAIAAANAMRTSALTVASSIVFVFTGHQAAEPSPEPARSPFGRHIGDIDNDTGLPVVVLQVPSIDLRATMQASKPRPDV